MAETAIIHQLFFYSLDFSSPDLQVKMFVRWQWLWLAILLTVSNEKLPDRGQSKIQVF